MWSGFKSRRGRHMWVEFVVGSLLFSERFFSGYSGFPLSLKTNNFKFQFDQESGRRGTTLWMCYLQIIIYLFIYLFIYFTLESSYVARFRPQKVFPFVNIMRICSFRCDYSTQSCNSRNLLLQQCKTRDT